MAFWKQDKPIPIKNKQQLTASQQKNILKSAKLSDKDIQQLKKISPDKSLLNPNRRISLNKMRDVIKKTGDKKLAQKINKAFSEYQKQAEKYVDEFCQEQYEIDKIKTQLSEEIKNTGGKTWRAKESDNSQNNEEKPDKIKENIKKTREYDRKRERSEEYMRERMADLGWTNNKSSSIFRKNTPKKPNQAQVSSRISAAHLNKKPSRTSAKTSLYKNIKKDRAQRTTSISDIEKIKKEAESLPDLPI